MNRILLVIFLVFGFLVSACDKDIKKNIGADDIEKRIPEFYFESIPIKGHYINYDSDAIVFQYNTGTGKPISLENIRTIADSHAWNVIYQNNNESIYVIHFQRIDDPKNRYHDWHSLERLLVTFCNDVWVFSWIQIDIMNEKKIRVIEKDGTRWYRNTFLPMHNEITKKICS